MQITRETPERQSIQSYSDTNITVNNTVYQHSVIISREIVIPNWPIHTLQEINKETLDPLLELNPEIILIGHSSPTLQLSMAIIQYVWSKHVGIECMSIGSASRTFNVLLSEQRAVVAGMII